MGHPEQNLNHGQEAHAVVSLSIIVMMKGSFFLSFFYFQHMLLS